MAIKVSVKRYVDAPDAPPLYENTLDEPIITIGSDPAATVHLNNSAVAAEQVIIISEGGQPLLINRADGTVLNGARMLREARHPLAHGDQLRIGGYLVNILFDVPQAAAPSAVAAAQTTQTPRAPEATTGRTTQEAVRAVVSGNAQPAASSTQAKDAAEIHTPTPPSQAAASPPSAMPSTTPRKSFAAMLDSLRTEEDSFHFLVRGGHQSGLRVLLEGAAVEMQIGWDETGRNICFDAEEIAAPRAVVRKDWSGVVIEAQGAWGITVNNEPVDAPRRLRNGDQLMLNAPAGKENNQPPLLIFHEPASLVVLDSLLPQQNPSTAALAASPPAEEAFGGNGNASAIVLPPAATQSTTATNTAAATAAAAHVAATPRRTFSEKLFDKRRIFFGTFTLLEVLIMCAGTLIAAVFIFVLLTLLDSA